MLSLVMNPGLPEEQAFPLARGTATIGRTKDNDFFCLHKSLSRKHATLDFDGTRVRLVDLQSKNGIFFNGKRVEKCDLVEGDSFRCGDIMFLLEGATMRSPKLSAAAQTLPSPLAFDGSLARPVRAPAPAVATEDEPRFKDKLFVLIRASELLVSTRIGGAEASIHRFLEELVVLAVQVLEVDRIVLFTLDQRTLAMKPSVTKTFAAPSVRPYSKRVVDWVVDHGMPTSIADVSHDRSLPGDAREDSAIRGAMGAPINPGGGTIGVLYADSVSRMDAFRPDDLALLRALANLAAVAIESDSLRRTGATH